MYRVPRYLHGKYLGTRTEDEDPHQRQAQSPPRSKAKVARPHDASDRCWPISRERNVHRNTKIGGKVVHPTCNNCKVRGSGNQSYIILRQEVRHIFRTGRPTNFKFGVQMEDEDPYSAVMDHHQQGQRLRSRCHVVCMTGVGTVGQYKSRTVSPRNIKIGK